MFSKSLALKLANFSNLAYTQQDSHSLFLNSINDYTLLCELKDDKEYFGFVIQNATECIISFKGTDDATDFILDIDYSQVPIIPYKKRWWHRWWKPNVAMVHHGFVYRYNTCKSQINNVLSEITSPLYITGHSMGAAIATIAAADVFSQLRSIVYTFASPRPGNDILVNKFNLAAQESWRVANNKDIVPDLPPADILDPDGNLAATYLHVSTLYIVSFDYDNILGNHEIVHYITALQNIS